MRASHSQVGIESKGVTLPIRLKGSGKTDYGCRFIF